MIEIRIADTRKFTGGVCMAMPFSDMGRVLSVCGIMLERELPIGTINDITCANCLSNLPEQLALYFRNLQGERMTTKQKPIVFNTEMVRAILDGRKKQTRIVAKHTGSGVRRPLIIEKPKHKVGDVLYVRETWSRGYVGSEWGFVYKASDEKPYYTEKWEPSLIMPKEAARIFLKVTDVRVERLQDISEEDAKKEGELSTCKKLGHKCSYNPSSGAPLDCPKLCNCYTARENYMEFWDYNNGKKQGRSWADNPYVFVYEFERIENEQK